MKINLQIKTAFRLTLSLIVFNSLAGQLYAQDLNPSAWPHLKGYWKFQNISKLTKATVGKDLLLTGTHQSVAGPAVGDTAIRIAIGSYYTCAHGMKPNGGGDSVNQYTLMFDFKVLSFKKWHTFFKTDSNNNNDGECFIRPITGSNPGRIGVAATGYSKDSINPNQWYRLMISVNLGHYYRYYINGKLLHEGDTQDIDGRFALTPKMIFFGDDNQEDDTIDVASVAVFDTCMSAADIAKIGSIDPCVANPPKISLGRDTALCDYQTLVKNAGAGFKKYQWYNNSTQATLTLTKNIGLGKRNIWCKVTDVNGCTVADTFVLTYNAAPVLGLGSDQFFCQGYATQLKAGNDTSYQYQWRYLPKGNTLSNKSSLTTDSGGLYTVSVTSKAGCVSRDTIQITVYARPAKPTISITGSLSLCQGESVILSGPSGYFDYMWNKGANQQTISCTKSDTLKVKVVDNNNCVSVYSDSVVVKLNPLPPKPKLKLTGNTTFCFGDSIFLEAPAGYAAYKWEDGSAYFSRIIKVPGKYYVSVKDANNCKSANSDTITLKVNSNPSKPQITANGYLDFCEGKSVILSSTAASFYRWSDSNTTAAIKVSKSGKYAVKVGDVQGCWSVPSDSIRVVVHPLPSKPVVLKAGKDSLKCSVTGKRYRWFVNGVQSVTDSNLLVVSAKSGYYQVQVMDQYCWSVLSDSFQFNNSGLKAIVSQSMLQVYPNPAQTEITVSAGSLYRGDVIIVIYDLQGREVLKEKSSSMQLKDGVTLNVQHLSTGLYKLRLTAGHEVFTAAFGKY